MSAAIPLGSRSFDDRNINWRKLGNFEHFVYTVFNVDPAAEIADFSLKFEPGQRIFLHRHRALTHTFVVQGEHRIYEPGGALKEVRPVGSYTVARASDEPHKEGGGSDGAVVLYNTRGSANGIVFDVLDDSGSQVGTLSFQDLVDLFAAQGGKPGA